MGARGVWCLCMDTACQRFSFRHGNACVFVYAHSFHSAASGKGCTGLHTSARLPLHHPRIFVSASDYAQVWSPRIHRQLCAHANTHINILAHQQSHQRKGSKCYLNRKIILVTYWFAALVQVMMLRLGGLTPHSHIFEIIWEFVSVGKIAMLSLVIF